MTIKIAHLYYDILNLYGENANVKALKKHLEENDIKTEIHFLTIGDKIDFNKYDLFYMGMGTEHSQLIVLKDLLKYKKEIKKAIEDNKFFIITGNSYELFGKYIIDFNKEKIDTLDIFDYYTKVIDTKDYTNQANFRIASEVSMYMYNNEIKDKVIGFHNRAGFIYDNDNPLFKMNYGPGDNINSNTEGVKYKNFYATYTVGPLLIRNPILTNFILKQLTNKKIKLEDNNELKAYKEYIKNFPNL